MAALVLPIIVFNFVSGIIGGIWLALLGQWHVLFLGIVIIMSGAFVISLALAPSMIFMVPLASSKRISSSLFLIIPVWFLSVGYTYCVMGIWGIAIFSYFSNNVGPDGAIPAVMWSYAVATSAWNYLAQKDALSGNHYSSMSAFFNQIGCITLVAYTLANFRDLDIQEMAIWFSIPMTISMIIQIVMIIAESKTYPSDSPFDPID